jgi:hypothetical protein
MNRKGVIALARKDVPFNAQAFWQNIQHKKCKRKLKGALVHLEREMVRNGATEDMFACKMYLNGKLGACG